jgi:hypothetical protein
MGVNTIGAAHTSRYGYHTSSATFENVIFHQHYPMVSGLNDSPTARAAAGEGHREPRRLATATDVESTSTTTPTKTRNEDKLDAKPATGTPPKRGNQL